jgi:hypothetical protein
VKVQQLQATAGAELTIKYFKGQRRRAEE